MSAKRSVGNPGPTGFWKEMVFCTSIAYDLLLSLQEHVQLFRDDMAYPDLTEPRKEYETFLVTTGVDQEHATTTTLNLLKEMCHPAFDYFISTIFGEMREFLEVLKISRFSNPFFIKRSRPSVNTFIAQVTNTKRFTDAVCDQMKREYPIYVTLVRDLAEPAVGYGTEEMTKSLYFWRENGMARIPTISRFARLCMTFQTSSASSERVFSLLAHFFGSSQDDSLEDYITAACMTRYNSNSPHKGREGNREK